MSNTAPSSSARADVERPANRSPPSPSSFGEEDGFEVEIPMPAGMPGLDEDGEPVAVYIEDLAVPGFDATFATAFVMTSQEVLVGGRQYVNENWDRVFGDPPQRRHGRWCRFRAWVRRRFRRS